MTSTGPAPLRILILDNEFPPLGGGTGVINYQHMLELDAQENIQVDLVTSSRTRDRYEVEPFGLHSRIFKVPVDNQNIHHSAYIELLRYTWKGLRESWRLMRQQRYDVCWAYSTVPAGFIALVLHLCMKLPYILITQGPDIPWHEQRHYRLYAFLIPIIKLIWRHAAKVTAQSAASREEIWKTAPHLPVEVISNGVDVSQFAPAVETVERRGRAKPLTFLCVGRLITLKGQQYLLDAAAALCHRGYGGQFRVMFVGTGDNEDQLRAQVDRLALQSMVTFAGVVAHEDMPKYYAQADVFVLPSFNEGMSIALLEALAAGLPAIVTQTGGTSELIKDNGVIVEWADPIGLADALQRFVCEPQLCRSLGEQSRQIAQQYSWSAATESYVRLCSQVVLSTKQAPSYARMFD